MPLTSKYKGTSKAPAISCDNWKPLICHTLNYLPTLLQATFCVLFTNNHIYKIYFYSYLSFVYICLLHFMLILILTL